MRFLKALEEDREFRYAVAGLLGLGEVLKRLDELRQDFNNFVKRSERRWRENEKKWRQWYDTWKKFLEENERRWEEERRRWETWHETWKKFLEGNERKWKENEKRWEEANRRFSRIEEILSASVESQYSRYVWEDLREEIRARGESVIRRVRNAKVDNVDIDLLVETDRRVYVVEVKIKPKIDDVGALLAKAEVVRNTLGKEAVPIITGTWIGDDVEKYARGKGVLIYNY